MLEIGGGLDLSEETIRSDNGGQLPRTSDGDGVMR